MAVGHASFLVGSHHNDTTYSPIKACGSALTSAHNAAIHAKKAEDPVYHQGSVSSLFLLSLSQEF